MNNKYSVSIILPVYNEKYNITKVIENSLHFIISCNLFSEYELIVVNDGSRDGTDGVLKNIAIKNPAVTIITHLKNMGYGKALISGFKKATHPLVFLMDADGQFNISEIEKMFFYLDDYDIITGYRHKRKDIFSRVVLAGLYSRAAFLLFGLKLRDINCGFKLFKKDSITRDNIKCHAGVFYTEVLMTAQSRGYKIKEVPVMHFPRTKGKQTGASFKVIYNAALDLIKLKFFGDNKA